MASKATKGGSIGTKDMNVTDPISTQGPLKQTLVSYQEWSMNDMCDPAEHGDAKIAGPKGSKP